MKRQLNQKHSAKPSSGMPDYARVAEVSHELRLPVANLKLLIETLLDGANDNKEVQKHMLTRAHEEVERLQKLVTNLLALEKAASEQDSMDCVWLDFEQRASYALESIQNLALSKSVNVQLKIVPDTKVWANQEQFDQVLLNLIENAIKFTPSGGQVIIRTSGTPGYFEVSDTGIGIPTSEIPKIFLRFYRVNRSCAPGSTGLGLSIVKHIIDLHGARIEVFSQTGQGSIFKLFFPGPNKKALVE